MAASGFFDRAVELNDPPVKSGLCSICKGAHRLCGKDRCPMVAAVAITRVALNAMCVVEALRPAKKRFSIFTE